MSGENLTRENKVRGELVSPDLREVWRAEGEIVKEGGKGGCSLARLAGQSPPKCKCGTTAREVGIGETDN